MSRRWTDADAVEVIVSDGSRCSGMVLVALTVLFATTVHAQSEHQRAQNLATCLQGRYPSLCKRALLTSEELRKVDAAERRDNLSTCLGGKYPTLCRRHLLTPAELDQVVAAEKRENLKTCMQGRFPSLCKTAWLSPVELAEARGAERRENLRTCMTGRYPSLCKKGLLSPVELVAARAAEASATASRPAAASRRTGGLLPTHPRTSGCEDGHWVESVSDDGTVVKLEDGSVWSVDSVDAIDAALWLPTTDITTCDGNLINTEDGETVEAEQLQ